MKSRFSIQLSVNLLLLLSLFIGVQSVQVMAGSNKLSLIFLRAMVSLESDTIASQQIQPILRADIKELSKQMRVYCQFGDKRKCYLADLALVASQSDLDDIYYILDRIVSVGNDYVMLVNWTTNRVGGIEKSSEIMSLWTKYLSSIKLVSLAALQIESGSFEEAAYLLQAVKLNEQELGKDNRYVATFSTRFAETCARLALHYDQAVDYSHAVYFWQCAITERPDVAVYHYKLGQALVRQKSWNEALDQYELAVKIDPGNSNFFIAMSQVLTQMGYIDDALLSVQKALEITPTSMVAQDLEYRIRVLLDRKAP